MALGGAKFGDGASTGTAAVSLASLIGNRKQYRWLHFSVPAANSGVVTIATAATGGATTMRSFALGAAAEWTIAPSISNSPAGEDFTIDPSAIFIDGGHVDCVCYIAYIS